MRFEPMKAASFAECITSWILFGTLGALRNIQTIPSTFWLLRFARHFIILNSFPGVERCNLK